MKTDIKKILASKTKQALSSNILHADAIRQNIVVLDELKNLIPPLSNEEFEQLQSNILEHGCQSPLQLWQTPKSSIGIASENSGDIAYVLVDGHNRYKICVNNNLPFEVYLLSFESLKEAKDYMIELQLGRRNLSPTQISYFRGLRYNNEKIDKSQNLPKGQNDLLANLSVTEQAEIMDKTPKGQNDLLGNSTAERLADEYKVSPKTIKRDAEFAKGLQRMGASLRNDILTGKEKIDKNIIQKLSKIPENIGTIDDIESLLAISNQKTMEEKTPNGVSIVIQEKSEEILKITKRFSKSISKTDLQKIIELSEELIKIL
ncbi:hypothetical protein EMA8858_03820 [Emticicia aquatica]|uniref:ParB/Sulfiredoxin domain-containing protein n=1 Tax=Emticicia aquatica TaxID=1681835 RepID=A0ABN8F2J5_9BACT|nr:hypothetical protein [Emticicia aquatica]CAH0997686.1 hypothetical protein EMA8858_03820 [Emticicia aquatica]